MKLNCVEERASNYNWKPQFQEQKKQEWRYFLPFSLTQPEIDAYREQGWEVLCCYDYINGDFTAFR